MYSNRGGQKKYGNKIYKKHRNNYKSSRFHDRKSQHKKEYIHHDQLTEAEVGITEFISKLEGFSGIIKARYSDFQVNEINLDGEIAKLTDTGAPRDFVCNVDKNNYTEVKESPLEQISQEKWDEIRNLLSIADDGKVIVTLDGENLSKDDRTQIHKCVKKYFGKKIVAETVTINDKKNLRFKKFYKGDVSDVRSQWPEDKPEYVHFLVYKESMDTMEACLKISDCVKMSPAKFTYAGVKDKRAKTTQWFCVHKVEPWKLMKKTRPLRNVKVGNFTFKDMPLKLGQLQGNKFRIALRNVTGNDVLINDSMNHLKENGFINYYGLQRFGNNKEVPTYLIGINLLLGKWKEATELILKPKACDDRFEDVSKAKKIYFETRDAAEAYKVLEESKNKCVEARLLEGLKRGNSNDYVNALENIPRNMRLLYIHSLQSLIWNKMVSKRINIFGMKPVEGDFVLLNEVKSEPQGEDVTPETLVADDENDEFRCKQEVKSIMADEISNYTIYDIVLPLPGYDVNYPENMKEHYREALEVYGLTMEMPKQRVKTYTLCGGYRKLVELVKNLTWKVLYYNSPVCNLIRSDFEELQGLPEPKSTEGGTYKSLVMEFDLASSSYATMVLRDVLKIDTSSSGQARLNAYHENTGAKEKEKTIIIDDSDERETDKVPEVCEIMKPSGLLLNAARYEEFQNSILMPPDDDHADGSMKRKNNDDGGEEEVEEYHPKKSKLDSV